MIGHADDIMLDGLQNMLNKCSNYMTEYNLRLVQTPMQKNAKLNVWCL